MIITSLFPSFGVICGRKHVCLFLFIHTVSPQVLALHAFVPFVHGQRMRKMRVSPLYFPLSSVSPWYRLPRVPSAHPAAPFWALLGREPTDEHLLDGGCSLPLCTSDMHTRLFYIN